MRDWWDGQGEGIIGLVVIIGLSWTLSADWAHCQTVTIYPTIPGTNLRDYSQPGVVGLTNGSTTTLYPTIPGTNVRDYFDFGPSVVAKTSGDTTVAYSTIPGTNLRDYSQPGIVGLTSGSTTTFYPTIPGTNLRDYSELGSSLVVKTSADTTTLYSTIPGTNLRDYSLPGAVARASKVNTLPDPFAGLAITVPNTKAPDTIYASQEEINAWGAVPVPSSAPAAATPSQSPQTAQPTRQAPQLWADLPPWRQSQLLEKYPGQPVAQLYNQSVMEANPGWVPATANNLMKLASQGVQPKIVGGAIDMYDAAAQVARRSLAAAAQANTSDSPSQPAQQAPSP